MPKVYTQIDGHPGEVSDAGHEDWIEVLSINHGVSQPHRPNVGGRKDPSAMGQCEHQDFVFTKYLDKSSPKLNLSCSNGKMIPKVKVEIVRQANDKVAYQTYEMENVVVRSISIFANGGGADIPTEEVALSYNKITYKYTQVNDKGDAQGSLTSYWDMATNTGG